MRLEKSMPLQRGLVNVHVLVLVNEGESLLDHERLAVYQCALEFLAIWVKVIEAIPKGHGSLVAQLGLDHRFGRCITLPVECAEQSEAHLSRNRTPRTMRFVPHHILPLRITWPGK